ncbi:MAG: DUF308 domain-containing protein [Deltaproteobacteria bacterium]|nr:DUF308 domain-containing protein [Deltaproteobacteria bacterium]
MADERTTERFESAAWGAPFVLGLVMTLIGFLALGAAAWTSVASIVLFGIFLVATGLFEIGHGVRTYRRGTPLLHVLGGVLSVVVGLLLTSRPLAGLEAASLLLAGYFFANGLFRGITAIADRYPQWGWDLVYGVVAIVLGIIIVSQFPLSAFWVVGTLVGIEIIFRGFALMSGGLAVRHALRHPTRATL